MLQRTPAPFSIRADAGVRLRFGRAGQRTVRLQAAEWGGYRARFPEPHTGPCEAVLINTGGGMTGGDRFVADIVAEPASTVVVTTQAAEKIYRSDGPATEVTARLQVGEGACLHWLPQEAILFDRAVLKRQLEADIATDATLLLCESVYFGRFAMGELLQTGVFHDRWRVRRGGRLVFAEDARLDGEISRLLERRAIAAGARAMATMVMIAPEAEQRLDEVRASLLVGSGDVSATPQIAAGAHNGLLIARLLSHDAAALRRELCKLITMLAGRALPQSWQT